jgi:hypothetical protein
MKYAMILGVAIALSVAAGFAMEKEVPKALRAASSLICYTNCYPSGCITTCY